jgi:hypothetical protein
MVWQYGDVKRGYASAESERRAGTSLSRRAGGSALGVVADTMGALDRALASTRRDQTVTYDAAMKAAIDVAHRHARGVVVIASPSETPEQVRNLSALKMQIDPELRSASWFRFVDLSAEAALYDDALRVDGWNYASAGLAVVAGRIAPALLSLIVTAP